MITTLNQLTGVIIDSPYAPAFGESRARRAATSARVFSALDGMRPVLDPCLIYGDGITQADFDCMYDDIISRLSRNPKEPLTYADGMAEFKVIILPYGENEYTITVGEMIGSDPKKIKASYTCVVGNIANSDDGKKRGKKHRKNAIDHTEFTEIFYQIVEMMSKDMSDNTREKRVQSLNAWIYDY